MANPLLKTKYLFWGVSILISLTTLITPIQNVYSGSTSLVINEIMYDPTGADLGYEWIELYNPTDQTIYLSNWQIQVAGTTFKKSANISGEIEPDQYFLICENEVEDCDLYVSKLAMQNGGGAADGVQILDQSGIVIDVVVYDSPNLNNLTDENGVVVLDTKTAPKTSSGASLGRKGFIDSGNNFDDFKVFDIPTPGSINIVVQQNQDEEELAQTGSLPLPAIVLSLLLLYPYIHISNSKFKRNTNGNKESE